MSAIDYMKVIDVIALTLETNSHIEVHALDLKLYRATLTRPDSTKIDFDVKVADFDIELSLEKEAISEREFLKWLPNFEFYLEQNFLTNVKIEKSENSTQHVVKIIF